MPDLSDTTRTTIAYLTAGGAGMYCGSCMRDNTLAAALIRLGCDVCLIPTYTPIRTDEENVSIDRVFFGGINVYLQQYVPLARYLPRVIDRWLDRPGLIDWFASRGIQTSGSQLGDLAVSMLKGMDGRQRKEFLRLVDWLADELRPALVNLSNILIAGCVPLLRQRHNVPLLVTLQGDDLFLDELPGKYRQQAMSLVRELARQVDGFIVFSNYYAVFMSSYLDVPRERFHLVPMGLAAFDVPGELPLDRPFAQPPVIGYLARQCPAKGLHLLVDAWLALRRRPGFENVQLKVAGWLSESDRAYVQQLKQKIAAAGAGSDFESAGVLDRRQKFEFLAGLDAFSVPTTYHEPKGIFVLEALAAGVPVVVPAHGALPELISGAGGGRLFPAGDVGALAEQLALLLTDRVAARRLGALGRGQVKTVYTADNMARATWDVYRHYLSGKPANQQ